MDVVVLTIRALKNHTTQQIPNKDSIVDPILVREKSNRELLVSLVKSISTTLNQDPVPAVDTPAVKGKPVTYDEVKERAIRAVQDKYFNPNNSAEWEINKHMCVNEDGRACAIRALVARTWNVEKASVLIESTLAWRKENQVDTILTRKMDEQLLATIRKHLRDDFYGHDKDGYPVYFNLAGKCDLQAQSKSAPMDKIVEYHIQYMEFNQKVQYPEYSRKAGFTIYKATMVLDLKGFGSNLTSSAFMHTLTTVNTIDANYYFESINRVIIVNANAFFSFFWRTVKHLLPIETQQKFIMVSDTKQIQDYIDKQFIPVEYGGEYTGSTLFSEQFILPRHLQMMDESINQLSGM